MNKMRVGVVVSIVLVLAGCSGAPASNPGAATTTPSTAPSNSPSSASATPTPTPTPTVEPTVVTTAGYGDLTISKPVPVSTGLAAWDATVCGTPASRAYAGAWIPTAKSDADGVAFSVVTAKGTKTSAISEIDVWSKAIQTKSGAHVGTTEAELKKLYPTIGKPTVTEFGNVYMISDNLGTVVFSLDKDAKTVAWIQVIPAKQKASYYPGTQTTGCLTDF